MLLLLDLTFSDSENLAEQAVATSMVYLFRSLGTVYGVAASSAIIQNVLAKQLPQALSGIPESDQASPETPS